MTKPDAGSCSRRAGYLTLAAASFLLAAFVPAVQAQVVSYTEFNAGPIEPVLTRGAPGAWDELKREKVQVIQDASGFKMWHEGHSVNGNQATSKIGYATSADGLHWTEYAGNPVVNRSTSDQDIAVVQNPDGTYWMYIEVNNSWIDLLTSPDGIHWTESPANPVKTTAASPVVWREGSNWYMLYEHMAGATFDIWLATSNDGINWTDVPQNPVLVDATLFTVPDSILKEGSVYHLYYHNANNGMWHATSTNLTTWSNRQLLLSDNRYTSAYVFRLLSGEIGAYIWFADGEEAASNGSQTYFYRHGAPLQFPLVWGMDDGSGTIARGRLDQVHGMVHGGAVWTSGPVGGALQLDGVDDYVSTTFNDNLANWSVSLWVRSPNAPSSAPTSGPVQREANFQINWNHGESQFRGAAGLRVNGRWYAASFGPLSANVWYYLTATYDGETLRTYRDGVLITSNTAPSGPPDAEALPLTLGKYPNRERYFAGTMDDVRIYDRALSAAEITALMGQGLDGTPPSAPTSLLTSVVGQTVNLWWQPAADPESGISQYRVYRGTTSGGAKSALGFVPGANLSASDSTGAASTTYYYEVTAVNGVGLEGNPSNEASALTGDVPPAAPTGLVATVSNDDVSLDWADNGEQDLAGYRVFRGTTPGGPYAAIGPALIGPSAYADLDLQPGTYYYVVSAVDAGGFESARSSQVSATILPPPSPTTPTWEWRFNEGAGTTTVDASGNGMTGTLRNGTAWTAGVNGSGVTFDGVDDYVSTPLNQNLANFTVAVWVRSPAAPADGVTAGPVQREANFQINWNHGDANFRGAAGLRVSGHWYAASFGALAGNTWYHLVATYDGETLRTYRNGVLITSNTQPSGAPDPESKPLLFGKHATRDRFFNGTIDDVKIFDRALNDAEVAALMSN